MRKTSTLCIIILFAFSINAQIKRSFFRQFEIGGEGGVTIDFLTSRDPANNLRVRSTGLVSGMGGAKIRRYIDRSFFLEAAFLWKENAFGFRFKQEPGYWTTNGAKIFIIPLRAGYDWRFSNKMSIAVLAGIVPSFITLSSAGAGGYGNVFPDNNDYIEYTHRTRDEYKRTYLTLQPGISVSHLIKKRIKFSIGVIYYSGFRDLELTDVSYTINNGPIQNAVIANRGTFINYNGSLTYRFDLRKRR